MSFPLTSLSLEHATQSVDAKTGLEVLDVHTSSALIQAAGYLKYVRIRDRNRGVFFRGQRRLHGNLRPSLYRDITLETKRKHRDIKINTFLKRVDAEKQVLSATPKYSREAILQHYGLNTRWLDVVDNIWIALWFACHRAHVIGRHREFLHFEKRDKGAPDEYAYVLLVESAVGATSKETYGLSQDDSSATIDLRVACPSHFVRPHAQHGLLVRAFSTPSEVLMDFSPLIVGILRITLEKAIAWLGESHTLTTHALFPPPVYDYGYRELLDRMVVTDNALGKINHIGA